MIQILNRSHYPNNRNGVYCGRPSILGNPFTHIKTKKTLAEHLVESREQSIISYQQYFDEQIRTNTKFQNEINRLIKIYKITNRLTLICWCKPLPCHVDIIREYILQQVK